MNTHASSSSPDWDWRVSLLLLRNLGFRPRTILDVGAYNGIWAKTVHFIWPAASVFCVEANADLKKHLKKINWLAGFEIALLGETEKEPIPYFVNPKHPTGNSIYRENSPYFRNAHTRHLPMTTLDRVVEKNHLTNIDFIKIDTQGSELDIIRGGKKEVARAEFILLEVQNINYNLEAPDAIEVIVEMKKRGFSIFDIANRCYLKKTQRMVQFDVLFVRESSVFTRKGIPK